MNEYNLVIAYRLCSIPLQDALMQSIGTAAYAATFKSLKLNSFRELIHAATR